MASALLSLGVSAAVPSLAKADRWDRDWDHDRREHHDEWRHAERVRIEDIDRDDVPRRVMDRVNDYRHGRRIERIQYVRDDDRVFYRFLIDDRDHGDFFLDIDPYGHVIGRFNA
jgi:hypothetical protein